MEWRRSVFHRRTELVFPTDGKLTKPASARPGVVDEPKENAGKQNGAQGLDTAALDGAEFEAQDDTHDTQPPPMPLGSKKGKRNRATGASLSKKDQLKLKKQKKTTATATASSKAKKKVVDSSDDDDEEEEEEEAEDSSDDGDGDGGGVVNPKSNKPRKLPPKLPPTVQPKPPPTVQDTLKPKLSLKELSMDDPLVVAPAVDPPLTADSP